MASLVALVKEISSASVVDPVTMVCLLEFYVTSLLKSSTTYACVDFRSSLSAYEASEAARRSTSDWLLSSRARYLVYHLDM